MLRIGIDIGSTTIKCVILNENDEIIYTKYQRHYSHIKENILSILHEMQEKLQLADDQIMTVGLSGSAGMGIADDLNIEFVQEVYATRLVANKVLPDTDCIIELGGEDAKILFLSNSLEVRMNGTCAGGTGAFIDQMATLLNIDALEMNECAKKHDKIYPIASRCGVFAKTDIQPLLNQGANINDVSASIFHSVVKQTIEGLAQGREIFGNVVYLGGPLTFLSELRKSFDEELNITGVCPQNSLLFVALGGAYCATNEEKLSDLISRISNYSPQDDYAYKEPLFSSTEELEEFRKRHAKNNVKTYSLDEYNKEVYIGIDSGSTTLKFVVIDNEKNILYSRYLTNKGNPVETLKELLIELYEKHPNIKIKGASSTGYGEDLIKNAFNLDSGLVETVAHFTAAKHFMPNVNFIIDIGGQDIKCFKIEHNTIVNIFLNEACSSGCGSFLQTFANALGYSVEEFAKIGLLAKKPVDLGSRCTVFMNSSVKQAQKDGATIDNISAGLSISVVKNALYKVIRVTNVKELGANIVAQGGTFLNEAVLRAFEKELGLEVVCPNISGLMGAYGAALHSMNLNIESSSIITHQELLDFKNDVKNVRCGLCNNNCALTINNFGHNKKFISGNKCERPITKTKLSTNNIYAFIQEQLKSYKPQPGIRGKIGIPLVLNMYELLPFWHTFFTKLNFEVVNSGFSTIEIYKLGQNTIPSDTACYPAKLVHGHIEKLIADGIKTIFYPGMSYNIEEDLGDNHFNCPIVAYYPETINNNIRNINQVTFIKDYLGIHNKKIFEKKVYLILQKYFKDIKKSEIKVASDAAYAAYEGHLQKIREEAQNIIAASREESKQIIVLAGRPYHVDPEINHGLDKLIASFGVSVISEESISHLTKKFRTNVLNQWTYHARLYSAAKYVLTQKDMNLIQLVSFGCGLDAVTTDETKLILESNNKIYTQIKIDDITNLGAVKIRLRSLLATLGGNEDE